MRCAGFLLSVGAVLADITEQDDSSGLLQKKKTVKAMKLNSSQAVSQSCAAFGDPHFITFDQQKDKAHCYGPLGDYEIVKTETLSVIARYQGRVNKNAENRGVSSGIAVIQGLVVTGSLLEHAVVSIPSIDSKTGPLILQVDDTLIEGSELLCDPWATWRKSKCISKKSSMMSEWREKGLVWDEQAKEVVGPRADWTNSKAVKSWKKWFAHTCSMAKYREICPVKKQIGSFTVQHGLAGGARAIAEGLPSDETSLSAKEKKNVAKCDYKQCSTNSWIIDIPDKATIVVNQGRNLGVAVTIHDRDAVQPGGEDFQGQCGNFNGQKDDDAFERFACPGRIPAPAQFEPSERPHVSQFQEVPPIVVLQGPNVDDAVQNVPVECSDADVDLFKPHCDDDPEGNKDKCLEDCCHEWVFATVGDPVCEVTKFEAAEVAVDLEEKKQFCEFNAPHFALIESMCPPWQADADESKHQNPCVYDCCLTPQVCPSRNEDGVNDDQPHPVCIWTNQMGMLPFHRSLADPGVHFAHNDYTFMETDALTVQTRFSSEDPFKVPIPALTKVALTGYLLGEPRAMTLEECHEEETETWPKIEVGIKFADENDVGQEGEHAVEPSILIDGVEQETDADLTHNCFSIELGPTRSVLDVEEPEPTTAAREHKQSVVITINDCIFATDTTLAKVLINIHKNFTQDVEIAVDPSLVDVLSGYTKKLQGSCIRGNDDVSLNDHSTETPVQPEHMLFDTPNPTYPFGSTTHSLFWSDPPAHMCPIPTGADICQMWGDPHYATVLQDKRHNFHSRGRFMDHFQMGLYRLFKSEADGVEMQAFFCDARGFTTSVNGLAYKSGNSTVTWVRNKKSGPAYGHHIRHSRCIHDDCEQSAFQVKVDGKRVKYSEMGPHELNQPVTTVPDGAHDDSGWQAYPDAYSDGTFFAQQRYLPNEHDRNMAVGPTCIGDLDNKVLVKSHVPKYGYVYEPSVVVEVSGNLQLDEGGLCNIPTEYQGKNTADYEQALPFEDSLFSVEELFELCGVCGMLEESEVTGTYTQKQTNSRDQDGWNGCNPTHPPHDVYVKPIDVCNNHQINGVLDLAEGGLYQLAQMKCERFGEESAWRDDCVVEFCVSQMNDIGDMVNDIMKEAEEEEHIHEVAGMSGLKGWVWSWDQLPNDEEINGHSNPAPGCCDLERYPLNINAPHPAGTMISGAINYASTGRSLDDVSHKLVDEINPGKWKNLHHKFRDRFMVYWNGTLHVPRKGHYGFRLTGDDAAMMYIGDKLVVNNNGCHGMRPIESFMDLEAGEYAFHVESCEAYGGWGIKAEWKLPQSDSQQHQNSFEYSVGGGGFELMEGLVFYHDE